MHRRGRVLMTALALTGLGALAGCEAFGVFAVVADTWEKTGTSRIAAEYDGLQGKTVGVLVYVDPAVAMDEPNLVNRLSGQISARLATTEEAGVQAILNPQYVREFQLSNPAWPAMSYGEVASKMGVERLVWVEVYDHRLHEPGNPYAYAGMMAGRVGVVEAPEDEDGWIDDFAYEREIRVRFPSEQGVTPADQPAAVIKTGLEGRFLNRVTWLFYEHEEPNMIDY